MSARERAERIGAAQRDRLRRDLETSREAIDLALALRRTARLAISAGERMMSWHGLTDLGACVLLAAHRRTSASPSVLAAELGVRPTSVAGAVRRLEERGWLRRERHAGDRRGRVVRAVRTDEGEAAFVLDDFRTAAELLVRALSAEERQQLRLLLSGLSAAAPGPPKRSYRELDRDLEEPFEEWEALAGAWKASSSTAQP